MIKQAKKLDKEKREFNPTVLKTKEEVLTALHSGDIKSSKFQLLQPAEKLFVEFFVFGDHTAEEAMRRVIAQLYPSPPATFRPKKLAHQIITNPQVQEVLDELTVARDKKFMIDINRARDVALNSLMYIMATTSDDNLKAAVATNILSKAEAVAKMNKPKEEPIGEFTLNINLAGNPYGSVKEFRDEDEVVVIEVDESDVDGKDTSDRQRKQKQFDKAFKENDIAFEWMDNEEPK